MQVNRKCIVAALLVATATCLATTSGTLADDKPPSAIATESSGCKAATPVNAGNAHDQIIQLSQIVDPSGKLSQIIADYHPAPASGGAGEHKHGDMHVAASENEQVKREVDPVAAANATSSEQAVSGANSSTTLATLIRDSAAAATTTVAPAADSSSAAPSTAAPAAKSAVNSTTSAPIVVAAPTEASNVTVNVFLQLSLPDAKTEELINNPDSAISSTTTQSPTTTVTPAPTGDQPANSTTQASTSTAAPSTQAPATTQTPANTTTAAADTPATTAAAAQAEAIPKPSSRRRRRWALADPAAPVLVPTTTSAAPASSKAASTTSTPATTTTTTTSTTTTTTAAPTTSTTTTTAAPTTAAPTTTTTTTTAAPATTSTTTPAAPASSPKSSAVAATTTSTQATVELSAKDLANASGEQAAKAKQANEPAPIEILVSAVPQSAPMAAPIPVSVAPAPEAPAAASVTVVAAPAPAQAAPESTASGKSPEAASVASTSSQSTATTSTTSASTSTTTTTTTSTTTEQPTTSKASTTQVPSVAPVAAQSKPVEQAAGMQLIKSAEATIGGNGGDGGMVAVNRNEEKAVFKLSHGSEMKRGAMLQQQQQQEQVKHNEQNNSTMMIIDRANELALDNLNVIYDNDTEHIDLSQPQRQSTAAGDDRGQGDNNGRQAKTSFVHGEHFDDVQEQQDSYATCLLEPIKGNSADSVIITNLAGRLNFWQPIQNRGVMHLIARFRYVSSTIASGGGDQASARGRREKRESFQTPVEHRPPNSGEPGEQSHEQVVRKQRHHQIWLLNECPDGSAINDINSNTNGSMTSVQAESQAIDLKGDTLLAEVKSKESQGTVDVDAELVVGKFNLTDANSILNRCLKLVIGTSEPPGEGSVAKSSPESTSDGPKILGFCKIVPSNNLPPVSELEHLPGVSVLQPTREDLLFASSPPPSTSFSSESQSLPSLSLSPRREAPKLSLEIVA